MDIKMPGLNGIETTKQITAEFPSIRVIALTMFDDDEYITTMLSAGAKGYLLKNTGKEELMRAIREVHNGKSYFSSEATQQVMKRFMSGIGLNGTTTAPSTASSVNGSASSHNSEPTFQGFNNVQLTKREIEILKLIASELTNQEIADRLFISPRTVHSHRRNLMQKVGVKNTAGLVRFAIEKAIL
jgi:DNA-binding NarL/FixJ family response regulator